MTIPVCLTCRKHHSSRREYFYDAGNGLAHRIFSSQIQTPAFIGQGHKDLFAIHYFSLGRVQKRSPCKNEKIIKYSPLGFVSERGYFIRTMETEYSRIVPNCRRNNAGLRLQKDAFKNNLFKKSFPKRCCIRC